MIFNSSKTPLLSNSIPVGLLNELVDINHFLFELNLHSAKNISTILKDTFKIDCDRMDVKDQYISFLKKIMSYLIIF